MKFFNAIVTVELSKAIIDKAKKFSEAVITTVNYSDSNQILKTKIKDDNFISKLGEEAAKKVFVTYTVVTGPDYRIYDAKQKSWNDDLYVDGVGLAIKTMRRTVARRYGLSWTFQAGNLRRDKILGRPDAWVCFVAYDDENKGSFCNVYPPYQIKELIFKDPKLLKLKGHKLVVYKSDLPLQVLG
jgi:hypothetical protein